MAYIRTLSLDKNFTQPHVVIYRLYVIINTGQKLELSRAHTPHALQPLHCNVASKHSIDPAKRLILKHPYSTLYVLVDDLYPTSCAHEQKC